MSPTPPKFDTAAPSAPHCVCLSGLSDAQTRLLKLVGCLEALDFPILDATGAVDCPGPDHKPEVGDALRRFQNEVIRVSHILNANVWPAGRA